MPHMLNTICMIAPWIIVLVGAFRLLRSRRNLFNTSMLLGSSIAIVTIGYQLYFDFLVDAPNRVPELAVSLLELAGFGEIVGLLLFAVGFLGLSFSRSKLVKQEAEQVGAGDAEEAV